MVGCPRTCEEDREACAAPSLYELPILYPIKMLTAPGLALTARSEAQIGTYSVQRPSTTSSTSSTDLSKIIPPLLTAIDEEADNPQDAFQAAICLGWLHFVLDEPGLAVARLPRDFSDAVSNLSGDSHTLGPWTQTCIVKGAYIKGTVYGIEPPPWFRGTPLTSYRLLTGEDISYTGRGQDLQLRLSTPSLPQLIELHFSAVSAVDRAAFRTGLFASRPIDFLNQRH
jgi:hypothetical protein